VRAATQLVVGTAAAAREFATVPRTRERREMKWELHRSHRKTARLSAASGFQPAS
jgi:hypothetical protein